MAEDVVRCRPLVVGSRWHCRHCAPSSRALLTMAWEILRGPRPRQPQFQSLLLRDSQGISPEAFPSSFWTDRPMPCLGRENMGQR